MVKIRAYPLKVAVTLLAVAQMGHAYAVFTHEAVIDSTWDTMQQILVKRFPAATPDDLKAAHAFAYGGCVIQDMGYYPFGSHYFSDLAHYVRTADFVMALLREAQDLNETAFALGALAHYSSDTNGHPIGVNRAVAIQYPKLRSKYGNEVTYGENPAVHLKTEFGFDVIQVAQSHYAPQDYHDHIGFQVSKELLERAFLDTYGLELKKQFTSLDLALGTYRHAVSSILPEATKLAWAMKKNDIVAATPGVTKRKFLYNLSRASYEKEWGKQYAHLSLSQRFLGFLIRILPKVGPLRTVSFRAPTAQTETLFMKSFNQTLDVYRASLRAVSANQLQLANLDLDTGKPTQAGEYPLADQTYAKLLRDLAKQDFQGITPELRANLLAFYVDQQALSADMLVALDKLKAATPPDASQPSR